MQSAAEDRCRIGIDGVERTRGERLIQDEENYHPTVGTLLPSSVRSGIDPLNQTIFKMNIFHC